MRASDAIPDAVKGICSAEQVANLRKLSAYLRTLPEDYADFDMSVFASDYDDISQWAHVTNCGTAACAVGHGPKAGIIPRPQEDWWTYSEREFSDDPAAWSWCFDSSWYDVDNTVHGAADRIDWLLTHGVPTGAEAQMRGDAPLCYRALEP